MVNEYIEAFFEQLYVRYYLRYENWKAEIIQIMWEALYEARKRHRRYAGIYDLKEYAEKVILYHVDLWIKQNGRYLFGNLSLNQKVGDDSEEEMIDFLESDEPFCSVELFDFLLQLSRIKFLICKAYIFCYEDDEIVVLLNITKERLNEIKLELQEDFREGYLI